MDISWFINSVDNKPLIFNGCDSYVVRKYQP